MKPTKTILVCALGGGLGWAQSPSVVQNTRNTMNAVSNHATAASNQVLGVKQATDHQAAPVTVSAASATKSTATAGSAGMKNTGKTKKVTSAAARHHAQPKPGIVEAKSPETALAGSGSAASKESENGSEQSVNPDSKSNANGRRDPFIRSGIVEAKSPETALAGSGSAASKESENGSEQSVNPDSKSNANGRRDPFISPVVSHATCSGCSTGKKCLEIGTINLRGVVHGENGFIAVVSNSLNKAYFLRENDPVFNGYVMRITGDSIVFQETLQDRMGKNFTREIVKKITAPAV